MKHHKYSVVYQGFLGEVTRYFTSKKKAETWARQAGVFYKARILSGGNKPCK